MSVDKNHSEQFEKYLKGQMSPEEAHTFEREVLDDPFAREALEGYEAYGSEAIGDIEKLKSQITSKKKRSFPFMRIAAAVALLIVGSYSIYFFTNQLDSDQLAMEEESAEEMVQSAPAPDTIAVSQKMDEQLAEELENTSAQEKEESSEIEIIEEEIDDESLLVDVEVADSDAVLVEEAIALTDEAAGMGDKTDEFMVSDEIEESAKETVSEDIERIPAEAAMEVELDEKLIAENDIDFASTLSGKVAGVQVSRSKNKSDKDSVLDEVVVTTKPLKVEKRSLGNAVRTVDEDDLDRRSAETSAPATLRSTSTNEIITGRITDTNGEGLPGVNVVIKGTTTGVTSDLDGYFEIQKDENQTLIISYIGFESQEIEVGSRSYIDVTLGGMTELQEVVVTGYSTQNEDPVVNYKSARPEVGNRSFKRYLIENLNYPEEAKTNGIEGTVVLELIIDSSGDVTIIEIKKSLGYGCDEEAVRLVQEGPDWEPAEKNGQRVEDKLKVRVKFSLD